MSTVLTPKQRENRQTHLARHFQRIVIITVLLPVLFLLADNVTDSYLNGALFSFIAAFLTGVIAAQISSINEIVKVAYGTSIK